MIVATKYMLTTFDNPFNPFTDFNAWLLYDIDQGYNSCEYLGRIATTSDGFTDDENLEEIERAIDEIVRYDFRNIYKKVKESDWSPPKSDPIEQKEEQEIEKK